MNNKKIIKGANPYLPLWEHIPDGEPRVFTYKGETRLYVYGSHDTIKTEYCGKNQVVWSAPLDDLTDWRYEGVCCETFADSLLYAPDVVEKDGMYYMYIADEKGTKIYMASSENPAGPFENPVLTKLGFDPGILVDDDGRVYAYWGFAESMCAELDADMHTIKEGTIVKHMIPHCCGRWNEEKEHSDIEFSFFEASSIRKVNGKYVFIYSKKLSEAIAEEGYKNQMNCFLAYAYSDTPLGGWRYGGILSTNMGQAYVKPNGEIGRSFRHCNNHGSIVNVNGQWYVFYHRGTSKTEHARQGMLEPIEAVSDSSGRLFLGKITYDENHSPIKSEPPEMTSQGAYTNGIDAYGIISAGYACYLTSVSEEDGAYIRAVYEGESAPIDNIKAGTVAGFKYLQFGSSTPKSITLKIQPFKSFKAAVTIDSPEGECIAEIKNGDETVKLLKDVIGKHSVYFSFSSTENEAVLCSFDNFTFNKHCELQK